MNAKTNSHRVRSIIKTWNETCPQQKFANLSLNQFASLFRFGLSSTAMGEPYSSAASASNGYGRSKGRN